MRASMKIGQDVEVLSHAEGYRGGYFRCKIHDLKYARNNRLSLYVEYIDFPDQEFEWMQVLQSIPKHPRKGTVLMVRPLPPRIVSREELHQISGSTIVAIVSGRPWERRERVEWLENDVWWKAKVQGIREDGFVEVQQHKPPKGERREGDRHFVNPRLLRPAFSWTEAAGWTADPRRVTFLNLPEVLVSDTSMGEEPEPTSTTNAEASTCLLEDTKVVNNVGVMDGTRTTTSCTKEINNLGLQQCNRISDTEEVCNVKGTDGEQQIEAATVLATSLYRDRVLPNCDKQTTRGVTVQVEQDNSAWQVICVNHDRQGYNHDYYLGYCRSLEAANAARDAVKALLQRDGLSVDAHT